MQFQGAVIREQGVTFAVVVVKPHVINNRLEAGQATQSFQPIFPGLPIILMAQGAGGRPKYYGRRDIARFLSRVPVRTIPWREYSLA